MSSTSRRLRVGIAVLDCDTGTESDLRRLLPAKVDMFVTRVPFLSTKSGSMREAERRLGEAVRLLKPTEPDIVLWACTSSSLDRGVGAGPAIRRQLCEWSGASRAWTAMDAVLDHLDHLGADKVAVGSPYSPQIAQRLTQVVADAGYEVVAEGHLNAGSGPRELQYRDRAELLQFAISLAVEDADTVLLSCTALQTRDLPQEFASATAKNFTSSNLAMAAVIQSLTP